MHNNLNDDEAEEVLEEMTSIFLMPFEIIWTTTRMGVKIFFFSIRLPFQIIGFFFRIGQSVGIAMPEFESRDDAEAVASRLVDEELKARSNRN